MTSKPHIKLKSRPADWSFLQRSNVLHLWRICWALNCHPSNAATRKGLIATIKSYGHTRAHNKHLNIIRSFQLKSK